MGKNKHKHKVQTEMKETESAGTEAEILPTAATPADQNNEEPLPAPEPEPKKEAVPEKEAEKTEAEEPSKKAETTAEAKPLFLESIKLDENGKPTETPIPDIVIPDTEEDRLRRLDHAELTFVDEYQDNPYNNVFVESLENVTPDDLGEVKPKKKKPLIDIVYDSLRQIIFWAAVVAFLVSGGQIVYKLYAYHQADAIYDNILQEVFHNSKRDDIVSTAARSAKMPVLVPVNGVRESTGEVENAADNEEYNELFEMMKHTLVNLSRKNPEIVGWIRMEGDTEINYPVVQHEDNDYYLHYAYDGTYNPAGAIFLDCVNLTALSSNRHAIIYGHNMESGSPMFANLLHYQEAGFLERNRYIEVYTADALYTYEVFASYRCGSSTMKDPNHAWRMNFNRDDATFLAWIDAVRGRSDIKSDVKITAKDRILTLSTCTNANDDRYVVHAVLVSTVH